MTRHPLLLAGLAALAVATPVRFVAAAEPSPAVDVEFFERRIRPVLVERCYECHTGAEPKNGLRLDAREGVLRGGKRGAAVVAGDPEKSLLIKAIRRYDPELQMPPKEALADGQVADFVAWVKGGAPDPRVGEPTPVPPPPPTFDYERAREFWSFKPAAEPALPNVNDPEWAGNPVDRFIGAAHEAKGVKPLALADRRTLARRAAFDLTGLPPTPEEVEAFVNDTSPDAFERLIDRLLASPAYGERWGRHWLDVARYADTAGCNSDYPIPDAYRYRDYVIRSFNDDKPFDRFVIEQVAGDLLPAADDAARAEHTVATGYLALARRFGSRASEFHLTIEDVIDNTGKGLLGLSLGCARCHDHKYDPVPAADYYALYGIFNSTRYAFPGTEIYKHPKDLVPLGSAEEAQKLLNYEARLAYLDNRLEELRREVKTARKELPTAPADGKPVAAPAALTDEDFGDPDKLPTAVAELRPADQAPDAERPRPPAPQPPPPVRTVFEVRAEMQQVESALRRLEANPPKAAQKAFAVGEGLAHNARVHKKGNPRELGDEVPRGFLTVLGGQKLSANTRNSGRLELAYWIASKDNPLTARVFVNRIWQHHFGRGIVRTVNDFGARGDRPTHPELVDFLAARFVREGWSVKAMHRLIMTSRAYRLASAFPASDSAAAGAASAGADPGNDLFWRQNPRRLSAEEVRDAILLLAGSLDRTPAGPHPFPPESEWKYTQHKPFVADYPSNRRGVYLMQQRIRKHPFLATFDGADTNVVTGQRPLSTTALQALFMMNDPMLHEQADRFAVRVALACEGDPARIDYAHRLAFARPASVQEVEAGQRYLKETADRLRAAGVPWDRVNRSAWASYCRAVLGSNEFLFVD